MAVHRSQAGPLLQCKARWESKDAKESLLGSGVLLVCVNHVVDWKSIFIRLIVRRRETRAVLFQHVSSWALLTFLVFFYTQDLAFEV